MKNFLSIFWPSLLSPDFTSARAAVADEGGEGFSTLPSLPEGGPPVTPWAGAIKRYISYCLSYGE